MSGAPVRVFAIRASDLLDDHADPPDPPEPTMPRARRRTFAPAPWVVVSHGRIGCKRCGEHQPATQSGVVTAEDWLREGRAFVQKHSVCVRAEGKDENHVEGG